MCGIIGSTILNKNDIRDAAFLIKHRGPDATHTFLNTQFSLGHNRLSIIDLDKRSDQPFFDSAREIAITYNGEIYNFQELRKKLEQEYSVIFRTTSDTEVLVEGYRVWGKDLLPKLRGMFAFGIYDMRDHSIFLARDHAGIKPLYYSFTSGFHFASELKSVVSLVRKAGGNIRHQENALALFLVYGYIPSPDTPIEGIYKLERGSWLHHTLTSGKTEKGKWFPQTENIETIHELEEVIKRSVLGHCISDVPVGVFFSGGTDSSLIASILKEAGKNLSTFSVRVEGRPEDEPYFDAIAKHLGITAHITDFGLKEFELLYEPVLSLMDDPIADTSIFPTTLVSSVASSEVKVILSGEGGDELFLGYPRSRRLAHMSAKGKHLLNTYTHFLHRTPQFFGKNRFFSELASVFGIPSAYYLLEMSPTRDLAPLKAWREATARMARGDALWFDRDWYLENMLLRKTDMATMYASIEGRVPLLGIELWQNAPQFSKENLAQGGTKMILKNMLTRYVPKDLVFRKKSGFGIPI